MRNGASRLSNGTKPGLEKSVNGEADVNTARPIKGGFSRKALIAIVLVLGLIVIGGTASAADGDLDPTFDGDGKTTTGFDIEDSAHALAVQPDGKLVAAGSSVSYEYDDYNRYSVEGSDFALARYNADGSLDEGFDTNGRITTDFGDDTYADAYALALQTDDASSKILAAGAVDGNFALVRYLSDGSLDESFGTDGKVTTDFGGSDSADMLAIQTDGTIVVAGDSDGDLALARYDENGSPDESFGGGDGKVVTDLGEVNVFALAFQPDDKILAAGNSGGDFALARYDENGSLDASFGGGDGTVTTDFGTDSDSISALTLQPDGKVVAAGNFDQNAALARYDENGSLDGEFGGGDGKVDNIAGFVNALVVQPDGRLVTAGSGNFMGGRQFHLMRYEADGSLDKSFGGRQWPGEIHTDFGTGLSYTEALVVQSDNKLVAAGTLVNNCCSRRSPSAFALARYGGNAAPVANKDSYKLAGNKIARTSTNRGVLANDKDADNDDLSAKVVEKPKNGKLTLSEDGTFTYRPDRDFSGKDTFTYKATDGTEESKAAKVTIKVRPDRR